VTPYQEIETLRSRVAWLECQLSTVAEQCPAEWRLSRQKAVLAGLLYRARGRVVEHNAIVAAIWPERERDGSADQVKVLASLVRKRIKPFGYRLRCVWGVGYAIERDKGAKV